MPLQSYTDNFNDNSTEAGFQFTFFCDNCNEGYKTQFIESRSYKRGSLFKKVGGVIGAASSMTGRYGMGYGLERGMDAMSGRYGGMTPEWHKEHDAAFGMAQNEAKPHFNRCPRCAKWMCDNDWNEQEGLCVQCAPRLAAEVASARAEKMVADIRNKAASTVVFSGDIESKQTACSTCGKPAGDERFCSNCGSPLKLAACSRCGTENQPGARFCSECGTKLA